MKTGLPTAEDALRVCASYCSMVATCDAYYYFAQSDGKDCHLVDYELERLVPKSAMARVSYGRVYANVILSFK